MHLLHPLFPVCLLEAENVKVIREGRVTKCKKPGSLNRHVEGLLQARNTHLELLRELKSLVQLPTFWNLFVSINKHYSESVAL